MMHFLRDVYDIRKFEEVLQESYMMIPDSKRRLEASIENLRSVLVNNFLAVVMMLNDIDI